MSQKILVVVDMQNDFVTGSLGTKEAQAIAPAVVSKVKNFDGEIIFTQDTHSENYLETQEGRMLPVKHCIKGTKGWELIGELEQLRQQHSYTVYEKPAFGSTKLAKDLELKNREGQIESIEVIGLCTDICVISNALMLKAFMPELPILTDAACCAGVTPDKHNAALETMRSCQITVI